MMRQPGNRAYSLGNRLSLYLALGITVLWLVGVLISGYAIRHELDEAFDSGLQETAQRLLPLAVIDILDHDAGLKTRRIGALAPHEEFLTYLVRDQHGKIVLESHDADAANFPDMPQPGFSETATHRIYTEAAVSDTLYIEVAEPLAHRREGTMESTLTLVIPLALCLPFSFIVVWLLVHRGMVPVTALRSEIESRGAGNLSPVSGDNLPEEIGPIAFAVNQLMTRLQRSLLAERSFAANSAHELRTPIAGALAQTQRLLSTLPAGDVHDRVQTIEQALQRLTRISEKLMQLARAEGGTLITETPTDLRPILNHVVEEFRRDTDQGERIAFSLQEPYTLSSRMDGDAFGILMRNLIENALKHSPAGSVVDIIGPASGEVRVINAGPVIAPEQLVGLSKPFARGASVAEGSGLGLAIATAIADGAGAGLKIISPASGRAEGFEVQLSLLDEASDKT